MMIFNLPNNNFWKNKRVLITGHTGFKGAWLSVWLNSLGAYIYGYSLQPQEELNLFSNIKNVFKCSEIGDINDKDKLTRFVKDVNPDVIFHLAAQPLVSIGYEDPTLTWETNVMGTLNLLESLKLLKNDCLVSVVTTDKVYKNNEWEYGYRENDELGGYDPYSASKAAVEILVSSWSSSFLNKNNLSNINLKIATVRSGNVIGGGDWASNRIVPDCARAIISKKPLIIKNPNSHRPWLHVLETLRGYIILIEKMSSSNKNNLETYNFGPLIQNNKSVKELVEKINKFWPFEYFISDSNSTFHETKLLHLNSDKAYNDLKWSQKWNFEKTIFRTINWYKLCHEGRDPLELCLQDIKDYDEVK